MKLLAALVIALLIFAWLMWMQPHPPTIQERRDSLRVIEQWRTDTLYIPARDTATETYLMIGFTAENNEGKLTYSGYNDISFSGKFPSMKQMDSCLRATFKHLPLLGKIIIVSIYKFRDKAEHDDYFREKPKTRPKRKPRRELQHFWPKGFVLPNCDSSCDTIYFRNA